MNDGHFGYITNSLKETLGTTCQGCVQHSEKAMLEGVAPVMGENGVVEQVLLFTCNIGTDDSCRATCINKH